MFIWILLIIIPIALIHWAKRRVKALDGTGQNVVAAGMSAGEYARELLDFAGLEAVQVSKTRHHWSSYDPGQKRLLLPNEVFTGKTVRDFSMVVHEVGHAIQDKEGKAEVRQRMAAVSYSRLLPVLVILCCLALLLIRVPLRVILMIGAVSGFTITAWQLMGIGTEKDACLKGAEAAKRQGLFPRGWEELDMDDVLKAAKWKDTISLGDSARHWLTQMNPLRWRQ